MTFLITCGHTQERSSQCTNFITIEFGVVCSYLNLNSSFYFLSMLVHHCLVLSKIQDSQVPGSSGEEQWKLEAKVNTKFCVTLFFFFLIHELKENTIHFRSSGIVEV